jgi:hypothetical protein
MKGYYAGILISFGIFGCKEYAQLRKLEAELKNLRQELSKIKD